MGITKEIMDLNTISHVFFQKMNGKDTYRAGTPI